MNRIFCKACTAGLFLFAPILASSKDQSSKNSLSISFGLYQRVKVEGSEEYRPGTDDIIQTTSPFAFKSGRTYTGPITIGYQRALNNRFWMGINVTASYFNQKEHIGYNEVSYRTYRLGLALDGRYNYYESGNFGAYVYGALGVAYNSSTQGTIGGSFSASDVSKVVPLYQISPVGVSYGKHLKVFAEAGYGYKGIISIGLQTTF